MLRRLVVLVALVMSVAASAIVPIFEKEVTSDGWVRLGLPAIEVIADGKATISVWRGTQVYPYMAGSDTCLTLYENIPREISFSANRIDSVYVKLVDATAVLITSY